MKPTPSSRIPLAENERCLLLLQRLRRGPASTLELQRELPFVHVARQIWELRHWYGIRIRTGRTKVDGLRNPVALYSLIPKEPGDDQVTRGLFW